MGDDSELLRRFAGESSEPAFRELVARRVDFVYAAALRQVGGDAHLAQEITQNVFLDVARKARRLAQRTSITGWLYTSVRFAAAKALRSRARRLTHETEAHIMQEILSARATDDVDWNELRPVLDAAMHELGERDREAILLRFFEGQSLADVGAVIGLGENSARMRVERALEKLRERLARRGITSTVAALGAALANQPAVAVPASFVTTVAGTSLAGAAVAGGGGIGTAAALWVFEFMQTAKLLLGSIGALAAVGLGAYLGTNYGSAWTTPAASPPAVRDPVLAALREENRTLKNELAQQRTANPRPIEASGSVTSTPDLMSSMATLVPMRLLAALEKKKWVRPEMSFVDRSGKLTESFTALFNLTPAEQAALQGTVDRARERLADLERINATVTQKPDGKFEIKLKAFAADGGLVYNDLMREFASTLGPERDEVYRSLGAEQVETALSRFGAAERTVTVSRKVPVEGSQTADKLIVVRDETRTRSSSNTHSGDYKDMNEVAARLGTLVRLLPPNF